MSQTTSRTTDLILTGLAPAIWGSSYLVTTRFSPEGIPVTIALLRALPAGILLLLILRQLPPLTWMPKLLLLGALNFTLFWICLFVAAYRLPGGVAATLGATQMLIILALSRVLLGTPLRPLAVLAGLIGVVGVGALVLSPTAQLDGFGLLAAFGGAVSMALGTVLSRKWTPPVPPLTFTAWQLVAGGLLLVPLAIWLDPPTPAFTATNIAGIAYLGLIGGALTYYFFFRGIARLGPATVAPLGFLSPVTAVALGLIFAGESLSLLQSLGMALVFFAVWLGQYAQSRPVISAKLQPAE